MKSYVPPFFNHFSLSLNRKSYGNESHEKETTHIYASAADLLRIRIRNLNWYKSGHCKIEAREIDCLCCREIEVDTMLINSDKIAKREGSISPSSFYWQLPDYKSYGLT